MNRKFRISVLVSGGGTNLQAIIDGIERGDIEDAEIGLVISSSAKAYALERAAMHGIKTLVVDKTAYPHEKDRNQALLDALNSENTDLVVLAGYMSILDESVVKAYKNRIINIHPSLIPKHCGPGYYGLRVHRSVIEAGDQESGATVHYVDEGVDTGPLILQRKVPVLDSDTPESLAARVLETEHTILCEAIKKIVNSREIR